MKSCEILLLLGWVTSNSIHIYFCKHKNCFTGCSRNYVDDFFINYFKDISRSCLRFLSRSHRRISLINISKDSFAYCVFSFFFVSGFFVGIFLCFFLSSVNAVLRNHVEIFFENSFGIYLKCYTYCNSNYSRNFF